MGGNRGSIVRLNIYTAAVKKNLERFEGVLALLTREIANDVVEEAKKIVHVDTGALKDSIRIESTKTTGHGESIIVIAGGNGTTLNYKWLPGSPLQTDYAIYHEMGGRYFNGKKTPVVKYMSTALEILRGTTHMGVKLQNLMSIYLTTHGGKYP